MVETLHEVVKYHLASEKKISFPVAILGEGFRSELSRSVWLLIGDLQAVLEDIVNMRLNEGFLSDERIFHYFEEVDACDVASALRVVLVHSNKSIYSLFHNIALNFFDKQMVSVRMVLEELEERTSFLQQTVSDESSEGESMERSLLIRI